ncbi:hypothetical protein ND861_10840 [Leptospira sp. 2 VSF19]|uniref:Uncharacterized protein n=1 Tax=Leptospira soteropolitanensis TaxID=2950025 RepID=A0AAW5VNQ6_9LEPT|nr:hypothetical protein [Leptospira soteropolitanensis]MCW7493202.1 hypothetical protein [Leptospira soteropolitanensis]MCW7500729.1 hypothetical protein [Leptospira soteropolitanensis]MCW7523052.1 hypothetical protein [Leptospira soteropolitanensis]MCW7526841.1 hypothetical protein [Leptospira soteropolitanensis]MCW7530770.1 hypothetical protein [Leptospira soteropolitanensis]
MKEKTKKFLTIALSIYLILLSFQIWGDLTKQIRSTKKSLDSMKQLVQAYPHMFYPNHFQDITTLSIKFRELQGNEELYYIDNQVFQFDVLQMAAAPTSLNSFEMKLPKSGHIVIANPDSKIENKNAQLFQNCKPNITGEFYSICFWEKQ